MTAALLPSVIRTVPGAILLGENAPYCGILHVLAEPLFHCLRLPSPNSTSPFPSWLLSQEVLPGSQTPKPVLVSLNCASLESLTYPKLTWIHWMELPSRLWKIIGIQSVTSLLLHSWGLIQKLTQTGHPKRWIKPVNELTGSLECAKVKQRRAQISTLMAQASELPCSLSDPVLHAASQSSRLCLWQEGQAMLAKVMALETNCNNPAQLCHLQLRGV